MRDGAAAIWESCFLRRRPSLTRDTDTAQPDTTAETDPVVPIRALQLLVCISVGPAAAGVLVLTAFTREGAWGLAIFLVVLFAAAFGAASARRRWARGLSLALCALSLPFWAEVGLRVVAAWSFGRASGVDQGGGCAMPDDSCCRLSRRRWEYAFPNSSPAAAAAMP